ncbi:acyltransferase family protein [Mucilaginibacter sp.]|uniref:acyltransferase family protein n=1 Tax=Mucilaginibacter sp. TaxID=1882438 RepID=UPI0039C98728
MKTVQKHLLSRSLDGSEQRDYLFDNLKFILVALVVIGHIVEQYINQAIYLKAVFVCIYTFHVPLFVFISGYFSKSNKKFSYNVKLLLIPYLVFTLLWRALGWARSGTLSLDILSPPFHLWYLLSLFSWRVVIPIIKNMKFSLIFFFFLSLIFGIFLILGQLLSLSRTVTLFPFFILGYKCSRSNINVLRNHKLLIIPGLIMLFISIILTYEFRPENLTMLFWNTPYKYTGFFTKGALIARAILFITAILISIVFILITPSRRTLITNAGSRSLQIYILHAFFLEIFVRYFPVWNESIMTNFSIVLTSFLIIFILSRPFVKTIYDKIFQL